jgi:DNA replication protein DnaC
MTLETPLKKRFLMYAKFVNETYEVDEENKLQLKEILETVEEQKNGLVICGKTGSGKTFIFQVLNKIFMPPFHPKRIALKTSDEIVSKYEKIGDEALEIKSQNVCIDEIGREKIGKYFGSEQDVIQKVIQNRYNQYKLKGYLTYFTSNYSKSAIRERYGEHTFSRLNEMCLFINLGTSEYYKDRRINGGTFKNGFPEVLPAYNNLENSYIAEEFKEENTVKNIKDLLNNYE